MYAGNQSFLTFLFAVVAFTMVLPVSQAQDAEPVTDKKSVYKKVGPDGEVIYTDRPEPGAKEIQVPKGTEYTAPPVPAFTPSTRAQPKPKPYQYDSLAITSPGQDETIRDNTGAIPVSIRFSPSLRQGHRIQYQLDGETASSGRDTSYTFQNVPRGTHTITARIVDRDDQVLATASTTIHLHRASALIKPKPLPKPP